MADIEVHVMTVRDISRIARLRKYAKFRWGRGGLLCRKVHLDSLPWESVCHRVEYGNKLTSPRAPLVPEMRLAFLDYLRVEEHRTLTSLICYESHLQKFVTTVG